MALRLAMFVLWLALVAVGAWKLFGYESSAGVAAATHPTWPAASTLPHGPGPTLVMFVHPKCPCSAASLDELEAILPSAPANTVIAVVFVDGTASGRRWERAGRLPRVQRILDPGGVEATRFGAVTSGQVVIYDAAARLVFAGGITGSRGHAGDNVGRRDVIAALAGAAHEPTHAVFGCTFAVAGARA